MAEPSNPLVALSNDAAKLFVERAASSVVTVHGGGRWSSSGIHWRSGIIVTAEEILERDEDIKVTLPGGRAVVASLVGGDPSTDVAVLRFQPDGLAAALTADAASLRPGHVVLVVGNHEGASIAIDAQPSGRGRGVLVASIDPDGPAARAGLLVGDIVKTWNAKPVDRVREIMRFLGSDSIGTARNYGAFVALARASILIKSVHGLVSSRAFGSKSSRFLLRMKF